VGQIGRATLLVIFVGTFVFALDLLIRLPCSGALRPSVVPSPMPWASVVVDSNLTLTHRNNPEPLATQDVGDLA
jgi:hypothetical protein